VAQTILAALCPELTVVVLLHQAVSLLFSLSATVVQNAALFKVIMASLSSGCSIIIESPKLNGGTSSS
jgi:hypothetical protein